MKKLIVQPYLFAILLSGCSGFGVRAHVTCHDNNGNVIFESTLENVYITGGGALHGYTTDGRAVGLIGNCVAEERR